MRSGSGLTWVGMAEASHRRDCWPWAAVSCCVQAGRPPAAHTMQCTRCSTAQVDTSYEEVANELIADIAAEVAAGGWAAPHVAVPQACWSLNLLKRLAVGFVPQWRRAGVR